MVLCLSATLKAATLLMPPPWLHLRDLVFFFLEQRHLMALVLVIECLVVWCLLDHRLSETVRYFSLYAFGVCFIAYRAVLWLVHGIVACSCAGSLGWQSTTVSFFMLLLAVYLLAAGMSMLLLPTRADCHLPLRAGRAGP